MAIDFKKIVESRLIDFKTAAENIKRYVDFSEVDRIIEKDLHLDEAPSELLRVEVPYVISEIWSVLQSDKITYDYIKTMQRANWDDWYLNFNGLLKNIEKAGFYGSEQYDAIEDLQGLWDDLIESIIRLAER